MVCTFTELFTKDKIKKEEPPETPKEIEMKKDLKKMEIGTINDVEKSVQKS